MSWMTIFSIETHGAVGISHDLRNTHISLANNPLNIPWLTINSRY